MENKSIRKSRRERRKEKLEDLDLVNRIFMRLYYEFEELIWLMVGVGIFVVVLKVFSLFRSILLLALCVIGTRWMAPGAIPSALMALARRQCMRLRLSVCQVLFQCGLFLHKQTSES